MHAEFLPGNQLTLLNSGSEYFPALLAAIAAAQLEIYLESYIFADDEIGHEVPAPCALRPHAASGSGLLVDGFGARNFAQDFMPRLVAEGSSPCPTGRK
jgi:cardiolipin synthase